MLVIRDMLERRLSRRRMLVSNPTKKGLAPRLPATNLSIDMCEREARNKFNRLHGGLRIIITA